MLLFPNFLDSIGSMDDVFGYNIYNVYLFLSFNVCISTGRDVQSLCLMATHAEAVHLSFTPLYPSSALGLIVFWENKHVSTCLIFISVHIKFVQTDHLTRRNGKEVSRAACSCITLGYSLLPSGISDFFRRVSLLCHFPSQR